MPFNGFAEPDNVRLGGKAPVRFDFDETRPLTCFAGIWTRWTSVHKVREGETTNGIFGFLSINPNAEVGAIHPKAMPVILRTQEEMDTWMTAPPAEALRLQRLLPDGVLRIVAHGGKTDERLDQDWRLWEHDALSYSQDNRCRCRIVAPAPIATPATMSDSPNEPVRHRGIAWRLRDGHPRRSPLEVSRSAARCER
ncbi:MAG TPA: SOS response-associated peptidase family protein [Acetobacteraceae bacterium]|nr:SOS response-associated peptidase family protein [Acetobacteraceae bacterium]